MTTTLLENIKGRALEREAANRARYAAILWSGADAEGELDALMQSLGYSPRDVENHGGVVEEARALRPLVAKIPELLPHDRHDGSPAKRGELRRAREAKPRLDQLHRACPFLFYGDDGKPELPPPPPVNEYIPTRVDRRLLEIDPRHTYTAHALATQYGFADLNRAGLPFIGGAVGERIYFGATVLEWARRMHALLRRQRRTDLEATARVSVPDAAKLEAAIAPARIYRHDDLKALGIDDDRLRVAGRMMQNGGYMGADVLAWADMTRKSAADAKAELARMDAEDRVAA